MVRWTALVVHVLDPAAAAHVRFAARASDLENMALTESGMRPWPDCNKVGCPGPRRGCGVTIGEKWRVMGEVVGLV